MIRLNTIIERRLFLFFLVKLAVVLDSLTFQDKQNIPKSLYCMFRKLVHIHYIFLNNIHVHILYIWMLVGSALYFFYPLMSNRI